MIAVVLFLAVIAAIVGWFLAGQRLTAKPWREQGVIGDIPDEVLRPPLAAKLGLGVFLAVAGMLFALLISAYLTRMNAIDGLPLPALSLLWINTGILLASSAALQGAVFATRRDEIELAEIGLFAGGLLALCFLAGQVLVWRQLHAAGFFLASNPAVAFLYLITGLHGLHLAGGLAALGRSAVRAPRGLFTEQWRAGIELCAIYWHFLLAVWLVLFAVLSGRANDFVVICRGLVS
jgi:cytochrome c oxidase subunit 3